MPDVTILIPAYNAEQTIGKAIGSAISQSGVISDQIEVVVVDDGSTDETRGIASHFCRVIHTNHHGVGHARMVGEKAALGKWIAYLDADDWLHPHAIRDCLAFAAKNSASAIYTDHAEVREGNEIRITSKLPGNTFALLSKSYSIGHLKFVSRDLIEWAGFTDPSMLCCEDWDLAARISREAKWQHLPRCLYYRRMHDKSLTRNEALMEHYSRIVLDRHSGEQE